MIKFQIMGGSGFEILDACICAKKFSVIHFSKLLISIGLKTGGGGVPCFFFHRKKLKDEIQP